MPTSDRAGITLTYAGSRMKNPLLSINVNAKSFTSARTAAGTLFVAQFGARDLQSLVRGCIQIPATIVPARLTTVQCIGAIEFGCNTDAFRA